MQCEFTTSSPSPRAQGQLFVGLSGDSAGRSPCQYLFMAVSYSYLMFHWTFSSHCMLDFIVNKSHPALEFHSPEHASSQGLVVILSHQNN